MGRAQYVQYHVFGEIVGEGTSSRKQHLSTLSVPPASPKDEAPQCTRCAITVTMCLGPFLYSWAAHLCQNCR